MGILAQLSQTPGGRVWHAQRKGAELIRRAAGQFGESSAQRLRDPGQGAWIVAIEHQQVHQRGQVAALLVLGMKGDGAVKQGHQGFKAATGVDRATLKTAEQGRGQKAQALDVPSYAEQTPAIVACHVIGLGAGDGSHVLTGTLEDLQGFNGGVVTRSGRYRKTRKQFFFCPHHDPPVLLRKTLADLGAGHLESAQVKAYAGGAIDATQT